MTGVLWGGFIAIVIALIAVDLRVTGRSGHALTVGEALAWSSVYILLSLAFNVGIYFIYDANWLGAGAGVVGLTGREAAVDFFTAWLLEKSLSVDNIFVIALIFSYFGIRREHQHRVLLWGILGAIVFRGILILAGSELLRRFEWTTYLFGIVLIGTAVRMLVVRHDNIDPDSTFVVRLARRWFPVASDYDGPRFLVREGGQLAMTKLFIALLVIESFDLLFAIDSVPAALAVTTEPFIVFTSNIFAVLGLRALYFVLAGLLERMRYLKASLVFVLAYVGVKMMLSHTHPIPNPTSLAIIATILSVGVIASLIAGEMEGVGLESPLAEHVDELRVITHRHALGTALSLIGCTAIVFGLAALVAPGSPVPVTAVGAVVLLLEIEWARRWLRDVRAEGSGAPPG